MNDFLNNNFNKYEFRALFVPSFISILPLLITIIILFPSNISIGSSLVFLILLFFSVYLISFIARDKGKEIEDKLFKKENVYPTTRLLRYSDNTINYNTKKRYHYTLKNKLPELPFPKNKEEEKKNQSCFDKSYSSSSDFLRKNFRNEALTFQHNIEYGFFRNLAGLKFFGIITIILSMLIILLPSIILYNISLVKILCTSALYIFSLYFWFYLVTTSKVKSAAERYALSLLENLETDIN